MNLGGTARIALRTLDTATVETKLLVVKKIVRDLEDNPNESSFRLCRDLRRVLKAVVKNPLASAEQSLESGTLLTRVSRLDPRNQKDEPVQPDINEVVRPKEPVPDGYDENFINVGECIDRVLNAYSTPPPYSDVENRQLLQIFLGNNIQLDEHAARQIWLHLSKVFKSRGDSLQNTFTSLFPPVIVAVQAALCQFVNSRSIAVPDANCLSLTDQLGFCS